MRRKLVLGNWKMHGSIEQNSVLLAQLIEGLAQSNSAEFGVCPTALHLNKVILDLQGSNLVVGAQNVHAAEEGAFTGEVAAKMLAEFSVTYCLVGHSERRELFAETDQQVAEKFEAIQKAGLQPVLCVGESLAQREAGQTASTVLAQLDAVLSRVGVAALKSAVVAYEPIWAIGTGKTASPEQAQEVHSLLRSHVADSDAQVASDVRIVYGGSVKAASAPELFKQTDIDGGLVGGASLSAEEFISICKSADSI